MYASSISSLISRIKFLPNTLAFTLKTTATNSSMTFLFTVKVDVRPSVRKNKLKEIITKQKRTMASRNCESLI